MAQQIENNGDDALITTLEITGIGKLAQAFKQVGYEAQVPFYGAQAYGPQLPQIAGADADGTPIALTHDIVEDGSAAMQTFAQWYQAEQPGQPLDFFAVMGWAAAELCVDGIAAAGPAPTRDSVIAALNGVADFTADDFLAPRNPAAKVGATRSSSPPSRAARGSASTPTPGSPHR